MENAELQNLLRDINSDMHDIFHGTTISVILYGSYARGDFDSESDLDIAVVARLSRDQLREYHHQIVSRMSKYMMEYGILVNITDIPLSDFESYSDILPYYRNIKNEGVRLSA